MVRPVLAQPTSIQGTAVDGFVFVCQCESQTPWALIVFIRTSDLLHAVLVPVLEAPSAAGRFMTFLRGEGGVIRANRCRFQNDTWQGAPDSETLLWPKAELL